MTKLIRNFTGSYAFYNAMTYVPLIAVVILVAGMFAVMGYYIETNPSCLS